MLRVRLMDDHFLRHSEWSRRLGVASSVGLAGILSLPLMVFVIMPISLTSLSGPSTLLSLLATFVVMYLSVCHLVELVCAVPKNCVLYHFSFGCLGELPAFLVGCLCLVDSLAVSSLLLSSWSKHVNLLFRKGIHPVTSVPVLDRQDDSGILSADFDLFAAFGILFSLLILCCSLNVVSTISICFLSVSVLIISSCAMVAFFHADPQNWIAAGFFKDGLRGLLRASAALMVAFAGVEAISTMVEETQKPRKTLPTLLVLLTFAMSVAFFLIVMIFSLAVNVSSLSPSILVPDIFSSLNIPAARFRKEIVFFVFGIALLFGSLGVRVLFKCKKFTVYRQTLCSYQIRNKKLRQRNHPIQSPRKSLLKRIKSRSSVKKAVIYAVRKFYCKRTRIYRQILSFHEISILYQFPISLTYMLTVASICGLSGAVLSSLLPASRIIESMTKDRLLPLPRDSSTRSPIFSVFSVSLLVCLSLLLRRDLIFDVACTTTPIKWLITVCLTYIQHYLPEPLGLPQETSQYKTMGKRFTMSSMQESMADSFNSMDSDTLLHMNVAAIETERLQRRLEKRQKKEYEEQVPVLNSSVSQYQSIPRSPSIPRRPSGLEALNGGHNCVAEPCSPDDDRHGHIFSRDVPEIPYVSSFDDAPRPSSPLQMALELRKATGTLVLFMISSSISCYLLTSVDHYSSSSIVLLLLFLTLSIVTLILTGTIIRNDYLHRRDNKMPLFPYVSLCVVFLLLLVLTSSSPRAWLFLLCSVFTELVLYGCFGRWFSTTRTGGTAPVMQAEDSSESEEYRAIIGEDCTEM